MSGNAVQKNKTSQTVYNAKEEKEKNVIGTRLHEARMREKLTLKALRARLEGYGVFVQDAAINKWEKGSTVPTIYQLIALCYALNINIEEGFKYFISSYKPALNEEGIKKLISYKNDLIASGRYRPNSPKPPILDNITYIEKPVSDLMVSAGTGNYLDESSFEMVSFPSSSVPPKADFGVRVSGDSMEPAYHDGQIVWVQQCEQLNIGQVGIFVYDGEGYIKSYGEQDPEEDLIPLFTDSYGSVHRQPVMISFNKAYPPKAVSPYLPFKIIGKVL